jgi:hypothetical protein
MANSQSDIRLRQEVLQATCCNGKDLPTNPRGKTTLQGVGELDLEVSSPS